ncbi:MAG: hypothetical protein ABL958_06625, partial [Bdellovibrionia bacterium]
MNLLLCFLCAFTAVNARAELLRAIEPPTDALWLDVPLADLPFNSWGAPSMEQALQLSTDFLQTGHLVLERMIGDPRSTGARFAILGFDLISMYFPLGSAWLHEEWHRTVMTRRSISSYNDVYNIPIGSGVIAVSHVSDDDLIRLKRDHPAEFARL